MTDSLLPLGDVATTMSALPVSLTALSAKAKSDATLDKTAQSFEAMFATQMLQPMFEGIGVDPTFGGGHGEEVMRSFLLQEYGKQIAKGDRLGIASQVKAEMLRAQESAAGRSSLSSSSARSAGNAYVNASDSGAVHVSP